MGVSARFSLGSFEDTGLEEACADAVMSIDALLFAPDKAAALRQLRRSLRPGGRLVLTSWDYHSQPAGRAPQVHDHRPLFEAAGLEAVTYEETKDWRERQMRTTQSLLDASAELAAETGYTEAETRAELEEMAATFATQTRRFLLVAAAV